MTMRIETVYENVDQKWLDWYLKRLGNEEVFPGSTVIVEELKECGHAVFSSKDPTGPCIATTTYEIFKGSKILPEGTKAGE